jgi:hypothetical protein
MTRTEEVLAPANLAGAWVSWRTEGSALDRMGTAQTVRLFRSHGPFTAHMHTLADDKGIRITGVQFGIQDVLPALYRGAIPSGRNGMSWTDSMIYALNYALDADGQIFTCDFELTDVLALIGVTHEDHPGITNWEWVMQPNGKASLWTPPWLPLATPEAVAADHERLKRDLAKLVWPDGDRPTRLRSAERYARLHGASS